MFKFTPRVLYNLLKFYRVGFYLDPVGGIHMTLETSFQDTLASKTTMRTRKFRASRRNLGGLALVISLISGLGACKEDAGLNAFENENTGTDESDDLTPPGPNPDEFPLCGNGVRDPGEVCDIAATNPSAQCSAQDECTSNGTCQNAEWVESEEGNPCTGYCVRNIISSPANDDGCCPASADGTNDNDCAASCGDGTLGAGERCDTAITIGQSGACPVVADCDDGDPCTLDSISTTDGDACTALCTNTPMTTSSSGDGCCLGGSASEDSDCPSLCGNGFVEPGELCEANAVSGPSCPDTCPNPDPSDSCRVGFATGDASSCDVECAVLVIDVADDGSDGCCPTGLTNAEDPNCLALQPSCGNGILDSGETCDVAIPAGQLGSCVTESECSATPGPIADACQGFVVANAGTCQAECIQGFVITDAIDNDGCCFSETTLPSDDNDCTPKEAYSWCETNDDCGGIMQCVSFPALGGAQYCAPTCNSNDDFYESNCPTPGAEFGFAAAPIAMCLTINDGAPRCMPTEDVYDDGQGIDDFHDLVIQPDVASWPVVSEEWLGEGHLDLMAFLVDTQGRSAANPQVLEVTLVPKLLQNLLPFTPALSILGPDFTTQSSGANCQGFSDAGGDGFGFVQCTVALSELDDGERFWIRVEGLSGQEGLYDLFFTELP